jgi:hypothetical protein
VIIVDGVENEKKGHKKDHDKVDQNIQAIFLSPFYQVQQHFPHPLCIAGSPRGPCRLSGIYSLFCVRLINYTVIIPVLLCVSIDSDRLLLTFLCKIICKAVLQRLS